MVFGFAILLTAALLLEAGISGRTLAEVVKGEVGRGFALANISIPTILTAQGGASVESPDTKPASTTTPGNAKKGLYEVFYDPLGYYFDSGQIIQGAIGGHSDHIHVAAPTAQLRRLAEIARKQFNLTIREFAPYDPVDPVHTQGSFHYKNQAFDASGSAADMRAFAVYLIGDRR